MAYCRGQRSLHLQQHLRARSHTALLWAWPVRLPAVCQFLRSASHTYFPIDHPTASLPSTPAQRANNRDHPTPPLQHSHAKRPKCCSQSWAPTKVVRSTILWGRASSSFWPAGRPNKEPSGASYFTGCMRPADSQLPMPCAVVPTCQWCGPLPIKQADTRSQGWTVR
jgi:hypothetical protein